jgi:hypothetical protein
MPTKGDELSMSLEKHGIVIDCEFCACSEPPVTGQFSITVPLTDSATGTSGITRVFGSVSTAGHALELNAWRVTRRHPERSLEEIRDRVSTALNRVATQKVCGTRKTCPREVVRLVEKHGQP